ncbi:MAG: carboxypeptidase regulatory-like domain-containing protein [Bacteroidales bacterium]|nr:carboxypeptidase regulatory-like domain-containing protein [Bacteroidales bacterium]MCL2132865.1 carboxypeptidase regulatory-like domain-containing protein [Bacteroidales bacterium]
MQRLFFFFLFLFVHLNLFSQTTEYYLQIKINDRSDLNYLTRIVSIDKVDGLDVIAYASEREFDKLKTAKFQFIELEHPSVKAGRAITMATTVAQMANWDRYPTYDVYNQLMKNFTLNYPDLCKLDTVGTSVRGKNMLVLNVTSDINLGKAKPEVLMSSTMHGDETTGWILCMRLAEYLMSNYGTNNRITTMLDSVSIFIAPNTNPDGTYYGSDNNVAGARRNNYNNYDLNRNFPDPWAGQTPGGPTQKETTVMMDYAGTRNFVLAANYHGGAEVANYPWDGFTTAQRKHPDNDWYMQICRQYATFAQTYGPYSYFNDLNNGITNGGDWYVVYGGRQDYMGYWHNCREITLEVSNAKMVQTEQLPSFWNYNREAMLAFIENAYYGVKGKVTNNQGNPLSATITAVGHDQYNTHVATNPEYGNYYRMLSPGTYTLKFESHGYITQTIPNVVVANQTSTVYLNVVMQQAQIFTVSGTVLDVHSGLPLSGVTVSLLNSLNPPVSTDASGNFTIPNVTEGENQFSFEKAGYQKKIMTITVNDNMSICVALNVPDGISFEDGVLPPGFTTSGNQSWFITNTEAYHGARSIRSGAISDNQSSTLQYTLNCETAGEITYYAKISTETGGLYDYLEFFIDNVSKGTWYGEIPWKEYTFAVGAGTHTLKWVFSRDPYMGGGQNAVFVDFILTPKAYHNPPIDPVAEIQENNAVITWEAPCSSGSLEAYVLYRLMEGQADTEWTELANNITATAYTDNNWPVLPAGSYQYAVKSKYSGNNLSAAQLTNTLVKTVNPALNEIKINGSTFTVEDNMFYMADCGVNDVTLHLTSDGAIEVNDSAYTDGMSVAFINDKAVITIKVTTHSTITYILTVSKALGSPSMPVYVQRWDKTLAVVNNPANNGGHTFENYRWYLHGALLPGSTGGYILLNDYQANEYAAEAHSTRTGEWHKLCPNVRSQVQTAITVYPNPVNAGGILNLSLPEELNNLTVNIYDLNGNLVRQQKAIYNAVIMPHQSGMYIIEIQLPDGMKHVQQVVVL